jgi:large subunit ribosomal protein L18
MDKAKTKLKSRKKRQARVRGKIYGTAERPRLSVYRSNTGIYAQLVDDNAGKTLVSMSTIDKQIKGTLSGMSGSEAAAKVGEMLAARSVGVGIKRVVFDRGGRLFHGRVKALADAARASGLEF